MEILPKPPTTKGPPERFVGDAWFDLIVRGEEPSRVRVSVVHFAPGSLGDVEGLAHRVRVPCVPGAGREVHDADTDTRRLLAAHDGVEPGVAQPACRSMSAVIMRCTPVLQCWACPPDRRTRGGRARAIHDAGALQGSCGSSARFA